MFCISTWRVTSLYILKKNSHSLTHSLTHTHTHTRTRTCTRTRTRIHTHTHIHVHRPESTAVPQSNRQLFPGETIFDLSQEDFLVCDIPYNIEVQAENSVGRSESSNAIPFARPCGMGYEHRLHQYTSQEGFLYPCKCRIY